MTRCYVSLGSNIEPEKNLRGAVSALRDEFGLLRCSPVYCSRAVGFVGDDFLNLVTGFDSGLQLEEIQAILNRIEIDFGRHPQQKGFRARTLDIDLLLFGTQIIENDLLTLPRPEIEKYAFVLRPLSEIDPGFIHPILHQSLSEMWKKFQGDKQLSIYPLDLP